MFEEITKHAVFHQPNVRAFSCLFTILNQFRAQVGFELVGREVGELIAYKFCFGGMNDEPDTFAIMKWRSFLIQLELY